MSQRILALLENDDLKSQFKIAASTAVLSYSEKKGVASYFDFLEI
jgi:hypothetical protein